MPSEQSCSSITNDAATHSRQERAGAAALRHDHAAAVLLEAIAMQEAAVAEMSWHAGSSGALRIHII